MLSLALMRSDLDIYRSANLLKSDYRDASVLSTKLVMPWPKRLIDVAGVFILLVKFAPLMVLSAILTLINFPDGL